MPVQLRNDELIAMLRGEFQSRYEPNFAWKSQQAVIAGKHGLRGSWTAGAFDSNGDVYGAGTFGAGALLTYNGNPLFGLDDLVAYLELDGAGDYLSRVDSANLDITGTETYVKAADRGLTMGMWVYPQSVGALQAVIGKWNENGVNQRSYLIDLTAGNVFRARVSSAGTALTISSISSTVAVSADTWYYVEMMFDPSARLAINVNGTIDELVAGVAASIHSGTANFNVGAQDNGASNLLTGRTSAGWLCAMYHQDYFSQVSFEQTRAMYGV